MLKSIVFDLSKLRLGAMVTQVREKTHLNRPRLRNPSWFVRKKRTIHEDYVTPENESFIKEVVHDTYGPPAIIKGVDSYDQRASKLIKTIDYERHPWTSKVRRTGLIARKIGIYPLWLKNGEKVTTTLLQIVDNHVIKYIPPEEYIPARRPIGYKLKNFGCLLVGAESCDPSLFTKEYCGLFYDSGVMPKKTLGRFFVSPTAAIAPGTPLNVTHFRVGDAVDISGFTIDRGFQGVVKRHGFSGMPASHGVTKTHRRPGNIGGGGEKGRVWPGTKMPGHMGNRWRVCRGSKIYRINTKYNVMWVKGGSVPGVTNGIVYIYDTILPLRRTTTAPPYPTHFETDGDLSEGEDNIWSDDVHNFQQATITFKAE